MSSEEKIYLPMNCTKEMLNNIIVAIYEIGEIRSQLVEKILMK